MARNLYVIVVVVVVNTLHVRHGVHIQLMDAKYHRVFT